MSAIGNFLTRAKQNLISNSTIVTDPNNISYVESIDLIGQPDSYFPRIELSWETAKAVGYLNQRELKWNLILTIIGYKKYTDNYSETDLIAMWDFGFETVNIIYGLLDWKMQNPSETDLKKFIMFNEQPQLFVTPELFPNIATFGSVISPTFIIGDIQK